MTTRITAIGIILASSTACTTFSTVRSAEVYPGPSVNAQISASSAPGPETGWFWSFDCASSCDHPIAAPELGLTWGSKGGNGAPSGAVGFGLNGTQIFVDGYLQLGAGSVPFGIGGRTSMPPGGWNQHQIYARTDVKLGPKTRLLLNPALFIHRGRSPNGENPGSFVGFVHGTGLLLEGERLSFTPAMTVIAGRSERTSYGRRFGPERTVFGTASLGVTWHRRRTP